MSGKPLIADGDTGGDVLSFQYLCSRLEALGVSAVIVEDKTYPKRTSLAEGVEHSLEDPDAFVEKIGRAKEVLLSDDFLIFARIESLNASRNRRTGKDCEDQAETGQRRGTATRRRRRDQRSWRSRGHWG